MFEIGIQERGKPQQVYTGHRGTSSVQVEPSVGAHVVDLMPVDQEYYTRRSVAMILIVDRRPSVLYIPLNYINISHSSRHISKSGFTHYVFCLLDEQVKFGVNPTLGKQ